MKRTLKDLIQLDTEMRKKSLSLVCGPWENYKYFSIDIEAKHICAGNFVECGRDNEENIKYSEDHMEKYFEITHIKDEEKGEIIYRLCESE